MNTFYKTCLLAGIFTFMSSTNVKAEDIHNHQDFTTSTPIAVMGDHIHDKGDWMVSYRFNRMHMQGNRSGTDSLSPEEIVTTVSNPYGPPATLRVVPTQMDMDMHMFGGMYGVTEKLTLMAMAMYMQKEMDHVTFAGGAGTTVLGNFTTKSSGWGDSSVTGIYKLYETDKHSVSASLGVSLPTGSIKEQHDVLAPTGATPVLRLPYAMQLGSGTWDALPGLTYTGHDDKLSWGAQYKGTLRLESENSQGYRWGNKHALYVWGGYEASDHISVNATANLETQEKIKGRDTSIAAPVQTANPENYGGDIIELGGGLTFRPEILSVNNLELGVQISVPVYQDLNGVQMERDWNLTTGLSYRF